MARASNVLKAPDSLMGRSHMKKRGVYAPLTAIRNKALRNKEPASQEYLAGELMGIGDSHLRMFPEICERLERAEQMDWAGDIVMPANNKEGYEIANYGSFEGMYAVLVEPWLGKYDQLKAVYGKYKRGETSREEGEQEIRSQLKPLGMNQHSKTGYYNVIPSPEQQGNSRTYTEARLQRDHPALYEDVRAGNLSANAAAIKAGFRKKLTKFEQIVKWLPGLTPEERNKLKELL